MPPSFITSADGPARPPKPASFKVHLDLLGRLHRLLGAFAILCGFSLVILAGGTSAGLRTLSMSDAAGKAGVVILGFCAFVIIVGGIALLIAGRALDRRSTAGRFGALILAIPNLVIVPFGTALSVYAFWVLLNDEARNEFGRPPRTPARPL